MKFFVVQALVVALAYSHVLGTKPVNLMGPGASVHVDGGGSSSVSSSSSISTGGHGGFGLGGHGGFGLGGIQFNLNDILGNLRVKVDRNKFEQLNQRGGHGYLYVLTKSLGKGESEAQVDQKFSKLTSIFQSHQDELRKAAQSNNYGVIIKLLNQESQKQKLNFDFSKSFSGENANQFKSLIQQWAGAIGGGSHGSLGGTFNINSFLQRFKVDQNKFAQLNKRGGHGYLYVLTKSLGNGESDAQVDQKFSKLTSIFQSHQDELRKAAQSNNYGVIIKLLNQESQKQKLNFDFSKSFSGENANQFKSLIQQWAGAIGGGSHGSLGGTFNINSFLQRFKVDQNKFAQLNQRGGGGFIYALTKSLGNGESEAEVDQKFGKLTSIFQSHQKELRKAARSNNYDVIIKLLNQESQRQKLNFDFSKSFSGENANQFKSLIQQWAGAIGGGSHGSLGGTFNINSFLQRFKVDQNKFAQLNKRGGHGYLYVLTKSLGNGESDAQVDQKFSKLTSIFQSHQDELRKAAQSNNYGVIIKLLNQESRKQKLNFDFSKSFSGENANQFKSLIQQWAGAIGGGSHGSLGGTFNINSFLQRFKVDQNKFAQLNQRGGGGFIYALTKSLGNGESEAEVDQKFGKLTSIFQSHQKELRKAARSNNYDVIIKLLNQESQRQKLNFDFSKSFSGENANQFKSLIQQWAGAIGGGSHGSLGGTFNINSFLQRFKVDQNKFAQLNQRGGGGFIYALTKSLGNGESEAEVDQKFGKLTSIFQSHQKELRKAARSNNYDVIIKLLNQESQRQKLNFDFSKSFSGENANQFKSLIQQWAGAIGGGSQGKFHGHVNLGKLRELQIDNNRVDKALKAIQEKWGITQAKLKAAMAKNKGSTTGGDGFWRLIVEQGSKDKSSAQVDQQFSKVISIITRNQEKVRQAAATGNFALVIQLLQGESKKEGIDINWSQVFNGRSSALFKSLIKNWATVGQQDAASLDSGHWVVLVSTGGGASGGQGEIDGLGLNGIFSGLKGLGSIFGGGSTGNGIGINIGGGSIGGGSIGGGSIGGSTGGGSTETHSVHVGGGSTGSGIGIGGGSIGGGSIGGSTGGGSTETHSVHVGGGSTGSGIGIGGGSIGGGSIGGSTGGGSTETHSVHVGGGSTGSGIGIGGGSIGGSAGGRLSGGNVRITGGK